MDVSDEFVPSFETLDITEPVPSFAQAEYTAPKTEPVETRTGGMHLGSITLDQIKEAPYGYNKDGSVRKKRGRPVGSTNQNKLASGRDAKEVSKRLEKILIGSTGVLSVIRPHLQMTDQEANNIADPLSAYLVRQEAISPRIQEFLDYNDLIAAGIAFLAYLVRVYKDDRDYNYAKRAANADVVEAISNRRPSRSRNPEFDAAPRETAEVRESTTEDRGEFANSDGVDVWYPTPYIAGD